MRAIFLKNTGGAEQAFELRNLPEPRPNPTQILIDVEASGINFADVLARRGLYQDAPPLPYVPGYEVAGRIVETGTGVADLQVGQRVVGLTHLGGYAERAVVDLAMACEIPDDLDAVASTALGVQYTTAWLAARELTQINSGDQVLIHSAAGGLGTALVQIARQTGCAIFGTASGAHKIEQLNKIGVDYPIDNKTDDFVERIRTLQKTNMVSPPGLDVVFDGIGGKTYRRGYRLLRGGGRLVGFGAASMLRKDSKLRALQTLLSFGIYHPVELMMRSRSLIGVHLLKLAHDRPDMVSNALRRVIEQTARGALSPVTGGAYSPDQVGDAHMALESGTTLGKLAIRWR